MDKQPEDLMVCNLQCLLMQNGEILCNGKTIGRFKDYKKYLKEDLENG